MSIRVVLLIVCCVGCSAFSSHASERDEFRESIEDARWDQAGSFAYRRRWVAGMIVAKRWQEMKDSDMSSRSRFALLEFYWRYRLGRANAGREIFGMREDYLQLASELEVAESDLAFTKTTDSYFDRFSDERLMSSSKPQRRLALEELLEALKRRPEDSAVLTALDKVARSSYGYGTDVDLDAMTKACVSPASQIMLASLVVDWGSRSRMEVRRPIVESALPHLPDHDCRAAMLGKLLSGYTISVHERAETLLARYPRTLDARNAFGDKLAEVAARDVAGALQLLAGSAEKLGLTPEQRDSMKLRIVDAVGSDSSRESGTTAKSIAAAKQIFRSLLAGADPKFKGIVVDRAILFAKRVGDEPLLTGLANYRMKHAPGNDWHEVVPVVATHFMKRGEWQMAGQAWESWPASHGGCGSWTIFPSEHRQVRIAVCLLHQGEYERALRVIADALTSPRVDSRIILPYLLFQMYDRAGQLDDFERILASLESDEKMLQMRSQSWGGYDEQRIELLGLLERQWTVRGMLVVRSLADQKDWQKLLSICQSYYAPYGESVASEDRVNSPLEHSIAIEAARLLSESGASCVPAIRRAYQPFLDAPAGRVDDEFSDLHHEWIFWSLRENKSPEAARLLQDLKSADAESGSRIFTPDQPSLEKLINTTILWPAPAENKLPKTLPLNWPRKDSPRG